jgi:hypothetical protein
LGPLSILHAIYSLAIAVALALTTLMLTTAALLATLARALALLVGIVSPALLLGGLLLAVLMLLSALIRIIRHDWISFRKLPQVTTVRRSTSSNQTIESKSFLVP